MSPRKDPRHGASVAHLLDPEFHKRIDDMTGMTEWKAHHGKEEKRKKKDKSVEKLLEEIDQEAQHENNSDR